MSGAAAASNDADKAAVILDTLAQVGLAMRSPEKNAMVAAPFCTTALPLAPSVYNTLPLVMPLVNRIVDRVARNYELLVQRIGPSDEFSAKLAEIVREVYISDAPDKPKRYQTMMLGVIRSDYLLDQAAAAAAAAANKSGASGDASDAVVQNGGWKQVEYNTIASSFPALSTRAGLAMQRHHDDAAAKSTVLVSTSEHDIIAALERTHRAFCQRYSEFLRKLNEREAAAASAAGGAAAAAIKPAIIFVMNPAERNTGDIGTLVRGLQERFGLTVAYKSLEDLDRDLTLDPETGHGIVALNEEGGKHTKVVASIFYLRSLYREDEYNFPNAWAARLKMERTMAVKCPSVPYHLTTWKTVQALLFSDSKLLDEVLLPGAGNAANRALLRTFMMEHYILAEYKRNAAILPLCKTALQQPGDWILKSMRESYGFISEGEKLQHDLGRFVELVQNGKKGGGADPDAAGDSPSNEIVADNMYGQKETVREFAGHHLLVRRIKSAPRAGTFLRNGALVSFADLEDEVSTYGAILTDDSPAALAEGGGFPREIFNHECGYLIRTKSKSQRGGGVMAGVAALAVIALQH